LVETVGLEALLFLSFVFPVSTYTTILQFLGFRILHRLKSAGFYNKGTEV
jgi:hypothetical protein